MSALPAGCNSETGRQNHGIIKQFYYLFELSTDEIFNVKNLRLKQLLETSTKRRDPSA